jgi:N-methylhydantoinase A/oxoprolinase/acetone carboxylase beta subunit
MFVLGEGETYRGKASTTPEDESVGYWNSLEDALPVDIDNGGQANEVLSSVAIATYAGTTMMNALVSRTGEKVGMLVTKGSGDAFVHERGAQIHAEYTYEDKFHKAAHHPNPPLVPRHLVKEVTSKINGQGGEVVPLQEAEVREEVSELLDEGVEGIGICFKGSYLNPAHENRAKEVATEVAQERGADVSISVSNVVCPIMREHSRLNSTALNAMAVRPVRESLTQIESVLQENGLKGRLQVLLADGGLANLDFPELFRTIISGPVGGLLGAEYISQTLDEPNIVCSDVGGTSFDVGLVTNGKSAIVREGEIGRTILNIPHASLDTIGQGTGSYVSIDPATSRARIGPESAGSDPGPVSYGRGNETPTIMDFLVIMGILNPDNYLGGKIPLDQQYAEEIIQEKITKPLGVDPYEYGREILDRVNNRLRGHIRTTISQRGKQPKNYYVMSYGGAGPTFMEGYTKDTDFKGVFTVPWAATFSAYGCACVDYSHPYHHSTYLLLDQEASDDEKEELGETINELWSEIEENATEKMVNEGFEEDEITFNQGIYLRFGGQLEDVHVPSPTPRLESAADVNRLLDNFERVYSEQFTEAAKIPEAGYEIQEVAVEATVPAEKPPIEKHDLVGQEPSNAGVKGTRDVYWNGWEETPIYDMEGLEPGNEIDGPAILEAPDTTLPISGETSIRIDEYQRIWLEDA